jgi:orotidine-5'-phosphate decarboxylase
LCRTSNPGGSDLQAQPLADGPMLYERIAELAQGPWNRTGQLGLVVGATYPDEITRVRALAPTLPLLIPGVGAQGGDAAATVRAGWRQRAGRTVGPVIVSASRGILYASETAEFAAAARAKALQLREELAAARI